MHPEKSPVKQFFDWSPPVVALVICFAISSFFSYKFFPSEFLVSWKSIEGVVFRADETFMNIPSAEVRGADVDLRCWIIYSKYKVDSKEHIASYAHLRLRPYICKNYRDTSHNNRIPSVGDQIIIWYDSDHPMRSAYNKTPKSTELGVFVSSFLQQRSFLPHLLDNSFALFTHVGLCITPHEHTPIFQAKRAFCPTAASAPPGCAAAHWRTPSLWK